MANFYYVHLFANENNYSLTLDSIKYLNLYKENEIFILIPLSTYSCVKIYTKNCIENATQQRAFNKAACAYIIEARESS